ncbi:MAG: ribbon-helix-helix protein, CopG family [Solirubrobacteraceae bacterium]
MKRTTISLPDDLADVLRREARRSNGSVSEIVRDALAAHLGLVDGERRELEFAALGRSGRKTTARDMEHLLDTEWDARARRS